MDEKNIINRCLNGDKEAFGMLVNKYQSQLLHFTWNILRDQDEAKDVTQETFVRSYFRLKTFDLSKSFKAWLYTIAFNRCMDKIRQNQSRFRFIKRVKNEPKFSANLHDPEKKFEDSEHLWKLLAKLNEKERTALSLKLNDGYLAREIGEILGCKESTVRVTIMNARRKLKKILEN
jgi:RNA polymerase sigma-70 factor (ECF subfamily)